MTIVEPEPNRDDGLVALRGGLLSVATGALKQVMSGVATFVLARVLGQGELGEVAAANSVVLVVSTLGLFGFNVSILRTPRTDRVGTSTVMALQLLAGALGGAVLLVAAEPLGDLVGLGDANLVRALAALLVLQGVIGASRSLLLRDRRYRSVYKVDLTEAVLYLVAQIALALAGWGAWAVIVSQLASAAFATVALARTSGWWFPTEVDRAVVRRVLGFGAALFAGSALTTAAKNADYWFVGGRLGISALGAYYVAFVLPTILRQRITWAANEALLPIVSRADADRTIDRRRFLLSLRLHALVGLPMCVGLAVVAPEVVRIGFGADYSEAAGPMRVIALAAVGEFLLQATVTHLTGSGRGAPSIVLGAVRVAVLAAGLGVVASADGGLVAVAAAVGLSVVVSWLVGVAWMIRAAGVTLGEHVREVAPAVVAAAAMAGVVLAVRRPVDAAWVRLGASVAAGVAAYPLAMAIGGRRSREQLRWLIRTGRRVLSPAGPADPVGPADPAGGAA